MLKTYDRNGFCTMRLMFANLAKEYRWSSVLVDRKADSTISMQFSVVQNDNITHSMALSVPLGGCLQIRWMHCDIPLAGVRHWKNILGRLVLSTLCKCH